MAFKEGQRVRLVGPEWADAFTPPPANTVTIQEVDTTDDSYRFVGIEGWWYDEDPGWEMELNPKTPAEHFKELAEAGEQLGITSFEQSVRRHTDRIANLLIEKNKAYGDSALNPVRIFSKADRTEQLYTRIDDKISRIQKGTDFANEDTIDDLIGYLFLLKIAKESA